MTARLWLSVLVLVLCSTSAVTRADFLSRLFPKDFEVVTNTDVLDPSVAPPTPSEPVYYMAVSAGYRDLGPGIAGEKIPKSGDVVKLVTKILTGQGYKLATNKHSPSLMIAYTWGTLRPSRPYPDAPYLSMNRDQMLTFLGAGKVGMDTGRTATAFPELSSGVTPLGSDAAAFEDMTNDGLYVISLSAYDLASAKTGKAKLLWRTNISTPSSGHYLPEVLPTMLAIAAPNIGRETSRPLRVEVGDKYKPNVEIGPATVIKEDVQPGDKR